MKDKTYSIVLLYREKNSFELEGTEMHTLTFHSTMNGKNKVKVKISVNSNKRVMEACSLGTGYHFSPGHLRLQFPQQGRSPESYSIQKTS